MSTRRRLPTGKPKVPGRPFQKGDDPRRHLAGRKCKEAIEFSQAFKRALSEHGDPARLAKLLWKKALAGIPWAIEMVLDRALGKATIHAELETGPKMYLIHYADESMADGYARARAAELTAATDPGPSPRVFEAFQAEDMEKKLAPVVNLAPLPDDANDFE